MRKFELTILKGDGEKYWFEGFDSERELTKWLEAEKSRPYWSKEFKVEIVDNSKIFEDKAKAEAEAAEEARAERERVKAEFKEFREKPGKGIQDCVAMLEKLVDYFGLDK